MGERPIARAARKLLDSIRSNAARRVRSLVTRPNSKRRSELLRQDVDELRPEIIRRLGSVKEQSKLNEAAASLQIDLALRMFTINFRKGVDAGLRRHAESELKAALSNHALAVFRNDKTAVDNARQRIGQIVGEQRADSVIEVFQGYSRYASSVITTVLGN